MYMDYIFSKPLRAFVKAAHVVVFCLATGASAATADESCGDLSNVDALVTLLENKNWDEIEITPRYAARIGQYVSLTQSSQFRRVLIRKKRSAQMRDVDRLMKEALIVANTKSVSDRSRLQSSLQNFKVVVQSTCGTGYGSAAGSARNAKEGASTFSEKSELAIERFASARSGYTLSLGVVLFLLFLVCLVVLARALLSTVYAYIYHRKTCRITASMMFGERTIFGYIVVLGRNGCRFEPEQPMERLAIPDLIASGNPRVEVFDVVLPSRLNGVTDDYFSLFFAEPMNMKVLNRIFGKSIITPVHRRKDIMKSNLDTLGVI
ncbi:hypothetical protein ABMC88_07980 [Sulfitobacter sp. HNIBRBA2951]|uniref:hypothetical protein n=1 Tax=Sulfitobacter aquimarinus TaxID=3158557 RepID=UPI0032E042D9